MAIDIQKKHIRNFLRLKRYDYSQPGAYFVTICTDNRVCYFGNIVDGIMISFATGEIVREIWLETSEKFQYVELDAFVIMPNHIHGIVIINKECRDLIHKTQIDDSFSRRDLIYQTRRINSKNAWRGMIHKPYIKGCKNDSKVDLINQAPTKNEGPTNDNENDNNHQAETGWILAKKPEITVGKIVRYFKAKSAKIIHDCCFHRFRWQRNYYEHVVRSLKELNALREYIINNPIKWALDRENRLSKNFNMDLDDYFKDIFEE